VKPFRLYHMLIAFMAAQLLQLSGCATYYNRHQAFQEDWQAADYPAAIVQLDKDVKKVPERDRLLFLLEKASTLRALDSLEASNQAYEEAFLISEDLRTSIAEGALSLVSNPMMRPFLGEDWELLQLHYFKALNHIELGRLNDALVEARRINIRLNELADERGRKRRYREDAFAWLLVGQLFDAAGDANSAFVSYRNALEIYDGAYLEHMKLKVPAQLEEDLLRTARQSGLASEYTLYRERFGRQATLRQDGAGTVIALWNNGLVPVKDEWSLDFIFTRNASGFFFVNSELGVSVPFSGSDDQAARLSDLRIVRVALPRLATRKSVWQRAVLEVDDQQVPMVEVQDLERLAEVELEDRQLKDLGEALLRLALKQSAEQALREQNPWLGFLAGMFNASTEKADTRSWQTLPAHIHYARLDLPAGNHTLEFKQESASGAAAIRRVKLDLAAGQTRFVVIDSPESMGPMFVARNQ
jgi:hypothetical protein